MSEPESQTMRGVIFDFDEPYCDVSEVSITKNKFYCKYLQGGDVYQIEASSRDGIIYRGNWGYPDFNNGYTVEVTRFESKTKEIVLLGTWTDAIDHYEGMYLVRLNLWPTTSENVVLQAVMKG